MQYILTEKEYLELTDFKERFENAQSWVQHKNAIIDDIDDKIKRLTKKVEQLVNENQTLREFNSKTSSYNNQLREQLKSAYMENFRIRTNAESEIERLKSKLKELL